MHYTHSSTSKHRKALADLGRSFIDLLNKKRIILNRKAI